MVGETSLSPEHVQIQMNKNTETENGIQQKTLFEGDKKVKGLIQQIGSYTSITESADDYENKKSKGAAGLGTLVGVYLPTIQNIFGVILFIRLPWIVGLAGIGQGLGIVGFCCLTTMLTAFSMSAIATNGKVPAGGSYYMISRSLGPGFGGAVGILFYLATSLASAMYILGAVEILNNFLAPGTYIPTLGEGDTGVFNNYRVYGLIFCIVMCLVVFVGVKWVNRSATVFLAIVIISIICIFLGFFVSAAGPNDNSVMCMLGDMVVDRPSDGICDKFKNGSTSQGPTELHKNFCSPTTFDPENPFDGCEDFFKKARTWQRYGLEGMGFKDSKWNWAAHYREILEPITIPELREKDVIIEEVTGEKGSYETSTLLSLLDDDYMDETLPDPLSVPAGSDTKSIKWVVADLTSSFMILIGIFFPSVTGIMAGSNRSGDLADGQKSIPIGTIMAILTTTISYLLCVIFFGVCIDGGLLRDKFGESLGSGRGGVLLTALIVWPNEYVMLVGAFLSTIGAGLQSLTGAPRLLQAIAKDDVIPKIAWLAKGRGTGNEPTWAVLVTGIISFIGIMIGNLDLVAPILTIFFLMCYLFVNVACTLSSLIEAPSWRPSFRFYHWVLSLIGAICCVTLIFITSILWAFVAFGIAGAIYAIVEVFGAKKEWGDSVKGLHMSIALSSLQRLGHNQSKHTKNWRPQILLLAKMGNENGLKYAKLLDFCSQLRHGNGLLVVKALIEGNFMELYAEKNQVDEDLTQQIKSRGCHAVDASVLISSDIARDIPLVVQTIGMSGLQPNTIILKFPDTDEERSHYDFFYNVVRHANHTNMSVIVTKNIENFPTIYEQLAGAIDIWWIRLDGGLTMLLAHLLRKHRTWRGAKLRIFMTAEPNDNSEEMRKCLTEYLYQMRISAEVNVIEVTADVVLPYSTDDTPRATSQAKFETQKDADTLMTTARKSTMDSTKPHPSAAKIPTTHTGTWSNNSGNKRSTVVTKMHEATSLNELISKYSSDSSLVLINMPPVPLNSNREREGNYMRYVDSLTSGLKRSVLVRGSGAEVITMYN